MATPRKVYSRPSATGRLLHRRNVSDAEIQGSLRQDSDRPEADVVAPLLNHPVGAEQNALRNRNAECFGCS